MKASKLISVRKAKKLSQADIATYLKISQTQYQKRETGKIKISADEWKKIAILLDVPIKEIYEKQSHVKEVNLLEEIDFLKQKIEHIEQTIMTKQ